MPAVEAGIGQPTEFAAAVIGAFEDSKASIQSFGPDVAGPEHQPLPAAPCRAPGAARRHRRRELPRLCAAAGHGGAARGHRGRPGRARPVGRRHRWRGGRAGAGLPRLLRGRQGLRHHRPRLEVAAGLRRQGGLDDHRDPIYGPEYGFKLSAEALAASTDAEHRGHLPGRPEQPAGHHLHRGRDPRLRGTCARDRRDPHPRLHLPRLRRQPHAGRALLPGRHGDHRELLEVAGPGRPAPGRARRRARTAGAHPAAFAGPLGASVLAQRAAIAGPRA